MGDAQALCDRILLIDRGRRVLYGTVADVRRSVQRRRGRGGGQGAADRRRDAAQRRATQPHRRIGALPAARRCDATRPVPRARVEPRRKSSVSRSRRPTWPRSSSAPWPATCAATARRAARERVRSCALSASSPGATTCARCDAAASSPAHCSCPLSMIDDCSAISAFASASSAARRGRRYLVVNESIFRDLWPTRCSTPHVDLVSSRREAQQLTGHARDHGLLRHPARPGPPNLGSCQFAAAKPAAAAAWKHSPRGQREQGRGRAAAAPLDPARCRAAGRCARSSC